MSITHSNIPAASSANDTEITPLAVVDHPTHPQKRQDEERTKTYLPPFFIKWYLASIVAHLCTGAHNAFSEYLTLDKNTAPPPHALNAFGNTMILLLYMPRILMKLVSYFLWDVKNVGQPWTHRCKNASHNVFQVLKHVVVYAYASSVFLKVFMKSKSLEYTNVIFLQSILLLTPFAIVLLERVFMRSRKSFQLPIILAFVVTFMGGVMLLLGETTSLCKDAKFYFLPDWHALGKNVTKKDWIGIAMAFVSMSCYAWSTLFVQYATSEDTHYFKYSCENLYIADRSICAVTFSILTFSLGDMKDFLHMTTTKWIVFFLSSTVDFGIGSYLNLFATSKLGGATNGLFLPLRLVSALFIAMITMHIRINSILQIIGIATIGSGLLTFMLWKKKKETGTIKDSGRKLKHEREPDMAPFSEVRAE